MSETFANLVIGISGKFAFFLNLEVATDGETFSGRCQVIPYKENKRKICSLRRALIGGTLSSELLNQIELSSVYEATISIKRDGHATIETQKLEMSKHEPERKEVKFIETLLAEQTYYFLKDVSHVHQHHDPHYDSIIRVTEYNPSTPNKWIENTQSSLYREMIRYKRFRRESMLFRASGILAYTKSFESSFSKAYPNFRKFNAKELEDSMQVSREELRHKDAKIIAELDTVRNWFFALFGFIISATFLARSADPPIKFEVDPLLISITKILAEKPAQVFFIVVFFSVVASFLTHRRDPSKITVIRTVLRWTQGFRIRKYFIANLISTAVFAWIFYYFLLRLLL